VANGFSVSPEYYPLAGAMFMLEISGYFRDSWLKPSLDPDSCLHLTQFLFQCHDMLQIRCLNRTQLQFRP
jgi:hypothetical protein